MVTTTETIKRHLDVASWKIPPREVILTHWSTASTFRCRPPKLPIVSSSSDSERSSSIIYVITNGCFHSTDNVLSSKIHLQPTMGSSVGMPSVVGTSLSISGMIKTAPLTLAATCHRFSTCNIGGRHMT
jgi:hypothetical protein